MAPWLPWAPFLAAVGAFVAAVGALVAAYGARTGFGHARTQRRAWAPVAANVAGAPGFSP